MASWVHLYLPPPSKVHCNHSSTHLFMLNCEQMEDREYMFIFVSPSSKIRRRKWHPTPVPLPGKSHGWRSLVGCSPWGREELYMTEQLHFHFSLSCIGEGNGNPLQYSCLENPRDVGAWWAAIYWVAQSQTRLKWLSSRRRCVLDKTSREKLSKKMALTWMK